MQQDHYLTLGVSLDASHEEIQHAYRRLVRLYHPDVNPGVPDAQEQLNSINQAYEVLRDSTARSHYDRALDLLSNARPVRIPRVTIPRSVVDRRKRDLVPLIVITVLAVIVLSMGQSLYGDGGRVPYSASERTEEFSRALATKFLPDQVEGTFGYLLPRTAAQPELTLHDSVLICSLGQPYAWMSGLSSGHDTHALADVSGCLETLQFNQ